jgi:ribosome-associated toxin RatA of RatAB toxin-antitoxin module
MADSSNLNDAELQATHDETEDALDLALDPTLLQEVDVQAKQLEGRQRQIAAKIQLSHPIEQVWKVLTDYESLAEFIPNLAKSQRVDHPTGGIRIEQVGTQRLLRFNFSARVVLDMTEKFPHEIAFNMIEGDFKEFAGVWQLEPISETLGTKLTYILQVLPKRFMPVSVIERRLQRDLAINLLSIRERLNQLF